MGIYRLLENGHDLALLERLGHVVEGAALDRVHGRVHGTESGDHHHGQSRVEALNFLEKRHPVDIGHVEVRYGRVVATAAKRVERLAGIGESVHLEIAFFEDGFEHGHDIALVVQHHHRTTA